MPSLAPADYSLAHIPFKPMTGADNTRQLAPTTIAATNVASGPQLLPAGDGADCQVEVYNDGASTAWVNFGGAAVANPAVGTGYPVPAGKRRILTLDPSQSYCNVIYGAAGPSNVVFTRGMGGGATD